MPPERPHPRHAFDLVRAVRRLPPSFLPVLAADALRAGPLTIARAAREILASDASPKLARIRAPTLVVWGEHDALVPPEIGRQVSRLLPDARFALIEGAGHTPMWDRPREFNRVVVEFLTGGSCLST